MTLIYSSLTDGIRTLYVKQNVFYFLCLQKYLTLPASHPDYIVHFDAFKELYDEKYDTCKKSTQHFQGEWLSLWHDIVMDMLDVQWEQVCKERAGKQRKLEIKQMMADKLRLKSRQASLTDTNPSGSMASGAQYRAVKEKREGLNTSKHEYPDDLYQRKKIYHDPRQKQVYGDDERKKSIETWKLEDENMTKGKGKYKQYDENSKTVENKKHMDATEKHFPKRYNKDLDSKREKLQKHDESLRLEEKRKQIVDIERKREEQRKKNEEQRLKEIIKRDEELVLKEQERVRKIEIKQIERIHKEEQDRIKRERERFVSEEMENKTTTNKKLKGLHIDLDRLVSEVLECPPSRDVETNSDESRGQEEARTRRLVEERIRKKNETSHELPPMPEVYPPYRHFPSSQGSSSGGNNKSRASSSGCNKPLQQQQLLLQRQMHQAQQILYPMPRVPSPPRLSARQWSSTPLRSADPVLDFAKIARDTEGFNTIRLIKHIKELLQEVSYDDKMYNDVFMKVSSIHAHNAMKNL